MVEVTIDSNENFEKALKKFNAQVKREGIVRKCRERQYYTKPSQQRRARKKR